MNSGRRRQAALGVAVALLPACGPHVTFSKDIAPILQAKCQSCHRPGQIAPMSLLTYEDARRFAPVIRASVSVGNMPPFYAAGPFGYYKDDIRLTEDEKKRIIDWADSGALQGDPALLPEPVEWDDSEWPLGEPDLVVEFPRHAPRPVNRDQFITLVTDYVFPEDLWARALHLKIQSNVVHHSTQFLWSPEFEVPPRRKIRDHANPSRKDLLFTWVPGLRTVPLPPNQAILLPKSWRIASQTHFGPTRKRVIERMSVGIYFADGVIDTVQKSLWVFITDLRIPPGVSDYTRSESIRFPEAALVTHFNVHMHLRGKSGRIIFHYPDGSKQIVFDLPRYRFTWQQYYYLAEPLTVPEGTVAEFIGVWDNSENNPDNPDPTVWCNWGPKTVDEMFGANVFYTPQKKLANPFEARNGRLVGESPSLNTQRNSSARL